MINVKLLKHTKLHGSDTPLATFQLVYPLFIHAEVMTHRVFSRNGASARAIPVKRMVELAKEYSTAPKRFHTNQAGMEPAGPLSDEDNIRAREIWHEQALSACNAALKLADEGTLNVHKQWANRLLMPFTHMSLIVTSDKWDNFFSLRVWEKGDTSAMHEINELATGMQHQLNNSKPCESHAHLPLVSALPSPSTYIPNADYLLNKTTRAVARISRESYMRTYRETAFVEDCEQIMRLMNDGIKIHASPFEHIAISSELRDALYNEVGTYDHRFEAGASNFHPDNLQLRNIPDLMTLLSNHCNKKIKTAINHSPV